MATVFVDECGYTGQDLLNPDQPIFVLASICASEEECQELKQKFFGEVNASELKHSTLRRYAKQTRMVLRFLENACSQPRLVKVFATHKQYTLVTRMVNLVVERAFNTRKTTVLFEGANHYLNNLLFYGIPALGGSAFFAELLQRFQTMMRVRTKEAYEHFFCMVLDASLPESLKEILRYLQMGHESLGYALMDSVHGLDVTKGLMLGLVERWHKELGASEEITLIPDRNSAMTKNTEIWDILVSNVIPQVQFDFDKDCKWEFPVGVTETLRNEPSEKWAGIQLADVLAGATARHLEWWLAGQDPRDQYGASLSQLLRDLRIPQAAICPDPSFPVEVVA